MVKDMGFPGIIENSFGSELNVINCLFQDNVYGDENNAAVSETKRSSAETAKAHNKLIDSPP